MNGTPSPLGRYSELVAAAVSIAVVLAWLAALVGLLPAAEASQRALDAAATFVLGVLLGQRATTNGAGRIAQAAHDRIDRLAGLLERRGVPGSVAVTHDAAEGGG